VPFYPNEEAEDQDEHKRCLVLCHHGLVGSMHGEDIYKSHEVTHNKGELPIHDMFTGFGDLHAEILEKNGKAWNISFKIPKRKLKAII